MQFNTSLLAIVIEDATKFNNLVVFSILAFLLLFLKNNSY